MIDDIQIITARMILRPPRAEDLDGWAEFNADPVHTRFVGGAQTRSEAWRSLCSMGGSWHLFGFGMFSMIERASGRWIGRAGPWQPEGWPGTEIGWGVAKAYEGKGYVTEAASAAMDYVIDVLGWTNIIHVIDPENLPSIAVAKRLGSTNLGPTTLPVPYENARVDIWGQSAEAWKSAHR
ncbi:MAG: GNAT family N-acetyltransferase [Sphingomonadaceae bacterium]